MQGCFKREKSFQEGIRETRKVSAFLRCTPSCFRFEVLPVISCDFSTTWYINQKIRQNIGVLIRQPAIDLKPESERSCVNVKR